MSDSINDNNKPWHEVGRGLKKVAGALIGVGAPMLANATLGPMGGQIVGQIVRDLGLGPDATESEIEKAIVAQSPEALVEIRRIEVQMVEAQNAALMSEADADTRRIESVNETIRAEVLGNSCAGQWRPLWGRRACYAFEVAIYSSLATTLYCVVFNKPEILPALPTVFGAVFALFTLPAAILGVASYHRGVEKRILAGEVRIPSASATPRDGIPRATPIGKIFKPTD